MVFGWGGGKQYINKSDSLKCKMKKRSNLMNSLSSYFNNKELNQFYISYFFKDFAASLVSIFIPIYLLTIGYSLVDISLYYVIYFASVVILTPVGMYLLSKIGVKKIFSLGTIFLIIYYLLLQLLDKGFPYAWVALILGISNALEYSAFNIAFTNFLDKKREGKELSFLRIVGIVSGIIGPIIGGIIIFNHSFAFTFTTSAILLVFSIIPLFLSKDFKIIHKKFEVKKIIKQDTVKVGFAYQISAILSIIGGIFWPIFIYLNVKNIISLGIIESMTSFLMIFLILYLGKKTDKNEKATLKTGVLLNAPSWIIRLFFLSPIGLFFTNLYASFSESYIDLSYNKIIFQNAKKSNNKRDYFLFREIHLAIGRIGILIIAILTGNIFWMFLISFFVTFGYLFLIKKNRKKGSRKTK
jgi:MFS family permease